MGQLTELLGSSVYIDANIVVYAVEGYEIHTGPIKSLLKALTDQELIAVTSELTLAEVLVKPKRDANSKLEEAYKHFLFPTQSLRNSPVSREVLEAAAGIRATTALKLPDAIHLATAINEQCDSFLTNDNRFKNMAGVKVILLEQLPSTE